MRGRNNFLKEHGFGHLVNKFKEKKLTMDMMSSLHCSALHCNARHFNAMHCTALHCTALNIVPQFYV